MASAGAPPGPAAGSGAIDDDLASHIADKQLTGLVETKLIDVGVTNLWLLRQCTNDILRSGGLLPLHTMLLLQLAPPPAPSQPGA